MRYAGIIANDFAAAPGVSLSFFTQGCPHRCAGCHNPETWQYSGGKEFTQETMNRIIQGLQANGVERSLAIMGGEPLCPENQFLTDLIIEQVKHELPNTKVYIWSGYTMEELSYNPSPALKRILEQADYLIDGRFILAERDITLPMRGSRNQRIWNLQTKEDVTNDF